MTSLTYNRILIATLCDELEKYLPAKQVKEVYRAYLFGAEAHEGQKRLSGEAYIFHPIEVAYILAQMKMDYKCIISAILHDVIEDTEIHHATIVQVFDLEIADIVEGLTKLDKVQFKSKQEAQAASFRKMLLAMSRDIRVILIKLADRLHNMRTLGVMRADKKRRIGKETLEIYAPMANRLGLNCIRQELEDLGMEAVWPWRNTIIKQGLIKLKNNRQHELIKKLKKQIKKELKKKNIKAKVTGREKRPYSIYQKMRAQKNSLSQLTDVFAFRVITKKTLDCYLVLGVLHQLFKPKPGRFKDMIAIPLDNGYQSLHTQLITKKLSIEVQIRDQEMEHFAKTGIASHWQYKSGEKKEPYLHTSNWLKELGELHSKSDNAQELLEEIKVDLFPNDIFVFTPNAQIITLPRGATVIDFAYAVHTDIGNHCVAASIENILSPLKTVLHNGETIDIHTNPNNRPNAAWLNYIVTPKARGAIRYYLRQLKTTQAESLGQRLLENELKNAQLSIPEFNQNTAFLQNLGFEQLSYLYREIGLGNYQARLVIYHLSNKKQPDRPLSKVEPLTIKGTEQLVVDFAHCCYPIPGDPVVARFSSGKGLVVHHQFCHNLCQKRPHENEQFVMQWAEDIKKDFLCHVSIEVKDSSGVLAIVANIIANTQSYIENLITQKQIDGKAFIKLRMAVKSLQHYEQISDKLTASPVVKKVQRIIG